MQMSFLDFLHSSTDALKSSIILNHSLHSLPLRLMLAQKAFPKNSRWRYWILKCDKQKQKYTDMDVPDFCNFFQKKSIQN